MDYFDYELKEVIKTFCIELKRLKGTEEDGWEVIKKIIEHDNLMTSDNMDAFKLQYSEIYNFIVNCI